MNQSNGLHFLITNYSRLIGAFLLCLTTSNAYAQNTAMPLKTYTQRGPIVLELFTSAGCPACPKADVNFNTLTNRSDIIALACHVTYFDRGNRKDPLSQPFCDARQSIYKLVLGTKGVFTPMMVIDGDDFITGSKPEDIRQSLKTTTKNHVNLPIGLSSKDNYLNIRLPQARLKDNTELWLIEYAHSTRTGDKNAINNFTKLMNWDGKALNMAFPVNSAYSYAVIAQSYKNGVIASGKTGP